MTTVAILPGLPGTAAEAGFMAVMGKRQAQGKTAGEALDAITAQFSDDQSASLVLVQSMKPDRFFDAAQQERLQQLMQAWKQAPEQPVPSELLEVLDDELKATIERSKALMAQRA